MKILSHRGLWYNCSDKNSMTSFKRSFNQGFGIETDIRDYNGEIVISHDIADENSVSFISFLDVAEGFLKKNKDLTLALNIKADGLQKKINKILSNFSSLDYFFFDMSIPDMKSYILNKERVFTRISNLEKFPIYLNDAIGVWLDNFEEEIWYDLNFIKKLLDDKLVCLVSPELHGYSNEKLWNMIMPIKDNKNLLLCTDKPLEARKKFKL